MIDRNDIMKALGNVMDPELGVDLVTLGMIRDVKAQEICICYGCFDGARLPTQEQDLKKTSKKN